MTQTNQTNQYNDYYLAFANKEESQAVLFDGDKPNFTNIDVIGTISKATGEVTIQDDIEIPVSVQIPGWHVNVRVIEGEDTSSIEPYAVSPSSPIRVWG